MLVVVVIVIMFVLVIVWILVIWWIKLVKIWVMLGVMLVMSYYGECW